MIYKRHYEGGDMEEWRDVVGYEDYYQVSSLGRVRSKDRRYDRKKGERARKCHKGRLRKIQKTWDGYSVVSITVNGFTKLMKVHRLVAMAFIPNPHDYPCINHKDEHRANNSVENLEWCTHKYNSNYGNCAKNISKGRKKPVVSISQNGEITWYPSAKDAEKSGYKNSNISRCARGLYATHGGLVWRYAEEIAI